MDSASSSNEINDIRSRTTAELFSLYRAILRELEAREIVRTENAPTGDYAEYLVARAFAGSTLAPASEKSWDVLTSSNERLQVKCRVVSDPRDRGQRQLSVFRSFEFDRAAIVLFDNDYAIFKAALIPKGVVESKSAYRQHVNGWICFATDALFEDPEAEDISDLLRKVARREPVTSALVDDSWWESHIDGKEQLVPTDASTIASPHRRSLGTPSPTVSRSRCRNGHGTLLVPGVS